MNINQVLKGISMGRSYSRPIFKKNNRYTLKIVSINKKPWIWSKTTIPGIYSWDPIENITDIEDIHRNANDWTKVKPPED